MGVPRFFLVILATKSGTPVIQQSVVYQSVNYWYYHLLSSYGCYIVVQLLSIVTILQITSPSIIDSLLLWVLSMDHCHLSTAVLIDNLSSYELSMGYNLLIYSNTSYHLFQSVPTWAFTFKIGLPMATRKCLSHPWVEKWFGFCLGKNMKVSHV